MPSYIDLPQKEEFTDTINEIIELQSNRKFLFMSNISDNNIRKEAIGILQERCESLREIVRNLQSSVLTENNRTFTTKDAEYISGTVNPKAAIGDYEIEVLKLGDKQLLVSEVFTDEIELPESYIEFEVAGENFSLEYQGGDAKNFARIFNEVSKGTFTANWIQKSSEENFFVVQANQVGEAHRLNLLKDSGDLFQRLKIFKSTPPIIKTFITIETLASGGFQTYNDDGVGVIIPPGASHPPQPVSQSKEGGDIESGGESFEVEPGALPLGFTVDFLETQNVFFKVGFVPLKTATEKVSNEAIENNGENSNLSNQNLNASKKETEIVKDQSENNTKKTIQEELKLRNEPILTLKYRAEGGLRSKTFTWKNVYDDRIWISDRSLGASLDKNVEFLSIKFVNDSTYPYKVGKWFRSIYNTNQDKYLPINEKVSPDKVQFRFYSIDMERESAVIDDLIDGATIKLLKAKEEPIKFSIQQSVGGYHDQIINFIRQYNYTLDFINLTLAPKEEDLSTVDLDPKFINKLGVFTAERDIQRLKDKMKKILQEGYVIEQDEKPVFLQNFGMKIFTSYSKPYHIDSAKIELDEDVFQNELAKYGDNIKRLFRNDQDGDFIPDGGFAYLMDKLLTDYLGPNSVFTFMERDLEREEESLKRSLELEQGRIDNYRQRLERDFSKVKQIREQQKDLEGWFDSLKQ